MGEAQLIPALPDRSLDGVDSSDGCVRQINRLWQRGPISLNPIGKPEYTETISFSDRHPAIRLPVELSCKSEYALLALLELAAHYDSGEPLQIRQISSQQQIPDRYLEQLLASLRRGGLLRSQRGAKGGYLLAREPWKITLLDVVSCLDGGGEAPTPTKSLESVVIGEIWQEADGAVNQVLQRYTLQDLCDRRDARKQLDIMYYI
jgi:Rrf2 family protein